MNTSEFRNSFHAFMANNEWQFNSLGYYVKADKVRQYLSLPMLLLSKQRPYDFLGRSTGFGLSEKSLNAEEILDVFVKVVYESLIESFSSIASEKEELKTQCRNYSCHIVDKASKTEIAYDELASAGIIQKFAGRPDMVPIELIKIRIHQYVDESDELLEEMVSMAEMGGGSI